MDPASQLVLSIGAALAAAALVVVLVRRRRGRRIAAISERRTSFGMSAVDPMAADVHRAAWEPMLQTLQSQPPLLAAPRGSRTAIGYAVPAPARTSGLADADHESTVVDSALSMYAEHHYRGSAK